MPDSGTPSRLVLLPELNGVETGEKVRFLGCVEEYMPTLATLTLSYQYQSEPVISKHKYLAQVDATHVLESMRDMDMQIGAWVNVIGYKTDLPSVSRISNSSHTAKVPKVQAMMLWDAREVNLDLYEQAFKMRKAAEG